MDCKTARQFLTFLRPAVQELEDGEEGVLREHLSECLECAALAQAERREQEWLGQAMRAVPIPVDLRDRLMMRLGRERRRWHVRVASQLVAAAALLAAAWLGYGYWAHVSRPEIDPERLVDQALSVRGQPPDQIEQWFQEQYRIKTVLPRYFNYGCLVSYERADFQGRLVPQLLFIRGNSYAQVYVLSAKQFRFSTPSRAGSGGIIVDLIPCPTDPDIVYLIYYNSASLDWLILEGREGA
jgi:hypothetical protein